MMEIYRNMIFGEMLPTIRIKIKMITKRRNLSPDQGRDLVVRKNRVAIAALVQGNILVPYFVLLYISYKKILEFLYVCLYWMILLYA